ncbi:hypothetical protein C3L33_13985, partial [Rhododendron williamsianum]
MTTLTPRTIAAEVVSLQSTGLYPFSCSDGINTCGSLLYQNNGLDEEQIATYYHVSSSQISPISNGIKHDFLVLVPCSCEQVNGMVGYFYGTNYTVQQGDTFVNVSGQIYSGQAWEVGGEEGSFVAGDQVEMELLCGCVEDDSQIMLLALRSMIQSNFVNADVSVFESERAIAYSLEEIAWATNNFHESRKIGEGGYGSVYYGVIGEQRVAVKKKRSNKEFFAELKALCKINHINVVELLGYAAGNGHLYLVYEYIQNGSLSEHLHDPLLKGKQPLSWTARATIALDAAKGIEHIHDHTKSRCVHRDIKTSNILLAEGPRAKVAGFGLAKLVERTNEDDLIATSLVGTPGYLPPESVKELQVTTKTDVFAFGVVLAELITGQRALIRDNREPKRMRSLVSVVKRIFEDENSETALECIIDSNLGGNYPAVDVFKTAKIAAWCLSEDPCNRPEMREIVVELSQIVTSSIEWEASLGGDSQVFSGVLVEDED